MRHPDPPGADGPANLLAASVVASSPLARGLGCLVVFNDEVHLPLFVHKSYTSNPATFRSAQTGPIGWISEHCLRIALRPVVRHYIAIQGPLDAAPSVAVVKTTLGEWLPARRDRIVWLSRTCCPSHRSRPRAMAEMLGALAQKMPVMLASRTGAGEVLHNTYGSVGSETDLLKCGLIHAGILGGLKARLLLILLLIA